MGTLRMEGGISFVKTKANTAWGETHGAKVCGENPNSTAEPTNPLPTIPILYI